MIWRPTRNAVVSRPRSSCTDSAATTLGVSRDDAARFLDIDVEQGIFAKDSFVRIDIECVRELIERAAERGRKTRPDIKLGICG